MAAPIVHKPADILRWLKLGAETLRSGMEPKVSEAPGFKKAVVEAFGKALDYGKGAVADISSRGIEKIEYRLYDDRFELSGPGASKTVQYRDVKRIDASGRGFKFTTSSGSVSIRPYAWLTVSGVKVPIGWERNGMEVPFELLAEELAARTKTPVQSR